MCRTVLKMTEILNGELEREGNRGVKPFETALKKTASEKGVPRPQINQETTQYEEKQSNLK